MSEEKKIRSLNKTILSDMSIEELESRLQMEELDIRGEMWTGCGCESRCDWHTGDCNGRFHTEYCNGSYYAEWEPNW